MSRPLSHPPVAGDRSRNLDVLRAVAALMVLWTHASQMSGEPVPLVSHDVGEALLNVLVDGVWLFFAISGYVITRSFVRALVDDRPLPSTDGYALRRAARIYPLYWVALAATIAGIGTEGARPWDLLAHVTLLHNLVPDRQQAILPPAWTLSVEILFYLCVPAVAALALRQRRRTGRAPSAEDLAGWVATIWAASIIWTLVADRVGNTTTGLWMRGLLPAMIGMFCPGILLAVAECARPGTALQRCLAWVDRQRSALWVVALGLVAIAGWASYADPADGIFRFLLIYDGARIPNALGFGLILVLARTARPWRSAPARALGVVGDWSYGVYLIHAVWTSVVLDEYPHLVPMRHGGVAAFVVHGAFLTALTLPSAWLAHRLLERPTMAWAARRSERWRMARAEPA